MSRVGIELPPDRHQPDRNPTNAGKKDHFTCLCKTDKSLSLLFASVQEQRIVMLVDGFALPRLRTIKWSNSRLPFRHDLATTDSRQTRNSRLPQDGPNVSFSSPNRDRRNPSGRQAVLDDRR